METAFNHQRLPRVLAEVGIHRNCQPIGVDQLFTGCGCIRQLAAVDRIGVVVHEIPVRTGRDIGRRLETVVPAIENAQVQLCIGKAIGGGGLAHPPDKRLSVFHLALLRLRTVDAALQLLLHLRIINRHIQRKIRHLLALAVAADILNELLVGVENIVKVRNLERKGTPPIFSSIFFS